MSSGPAGCRGCCWMRLSGSAATMRWCTASTRCALATWTEGPARRRMCAACSRQVPARLPRPQRISSLHSQHLALLPAVPGLHPGQPNACWEAAHAGGCQAHPEARRPARSPQRRCCNSPGCGSPGVTTRQAPLPPDAGRWSARLRRQGGAAEPGRGLLHGLRTGAADGARPAGRRRGAARHLGARPPGLAPQRQPPPPPHTPTHCLGTLQAARPALRHSLR